MPFRDRSERASRTRPPRRPRRLWLRTILAGAALALLVTSGIAALYFREITKDLPSIEKLATYQPAVASQVYASDGTLIGEFYFEKRYLTPLEEIPEVVRQAFLAAEDATFYEHAGIDLASIARAFLNNLFAGEVTQGGSTITQQVVKSLLLTPQKSYERKIKEVILARRLERELTKDQILELYLNQIYLGSGTYGVAAAAQEYFGKTVPDLTLAEASLLAGLPQAPSRYSPRRHPQRARARQLYVLRRMERERFITRAERAEAEAQPVEIASQRAPAYRQAPDYVEYIRRTLEERYGSRAPYQLGLRIWTAVDLRLQSAAERAVRDGLEALDRRRGYRGPLRRLSEAEAEPYLEQQVRSLDRSTLREGQTVDALVVKAGPERAVVRIGAATATLPAARMEWAGKPSGFRPGDVILVEIEKKTADGGLEVSLAQQPDTEGALLAIDAQTGYVRAMVGGYDFQRSQFNRAVQALRQPGSAFKPLVYASALDRGYTPASVIIDAPIVFDDHTQYGWKPENFDEKFHGATRLREALTFSRNIVSVKIAQDVGVRYILSYLPRFGLSRPFPMNLSIALGSSEVTLLELVRAYQVFATGGKLYDPIFILKITDNAGNVLEERLPSQEQTMSPETAYLMTSMLKEVVQRGTGRRARALNRPVAGKTGTTNDTMDAWFIGYTPDLVAGAWVGFDEKKTLGKKETGGRVALPLWLEFMESALDGTAVSDFSIPDGIVFVNIDSASGLRATPDDSNIVLESFRRGTEPHQIAHRAEGPEPHDFFRGDF